MIAIWNFLHVMILSQACLTCLEVQCRFLDPIVLGKYPIEMHEVLQSDLPTFSEHDLELLKSGLDFIGINHYTSFYVKDCIFSVCEPGPGATKTEGFALRTPKKNGVFIGDSVCNFIIYQHQHVQLSFP